MRDRLDLTGVVASFGGPLLVCVGDRDDVSWRRRGRSPRQRRGIARGLRRRGHFLSVDQPDRFDAVLLEFVTQWKT